MRMEPAEETDGLRSDNASLGPMDIAANKEVAIQGVSGKAMEIEAVFAAGRRARGRPERAEIAGRRRADAYLAVPAGPPAVRDQLASDRRLGVVAEG